jgi:cytochrome b subunit of formate dehydrogenase
MALKFSEQAWAEGLSRILGGIYFNGLIHRFCAIITFGYFSAHIIELFVRMKREKKRWIDFLFLKDGMVPNIRDVREFIQSVKWFVGLGPRPIYGRWTYWEKFDYFAVFWGVAIIGSTGLVLWFPEFFTRFFPGWIINIATIIHGDEALLAVGFIFTIHFFNTHFRPDKFPIDLVIFTGRVPFEVFAEERPRELAQLQADNSLESFFVAPPSKRLILAARIFGTCALITGLMLVGLIIGVFASKIW